MEFRYGADSHRLSIKAKNLFLLVVMLAIASSLLPACGGSQDLVVGSWKAVSTSGTRTDGTLFHRRSTVEFFEDGTANVAGKSAAWSWPSEDSLMIDFPDSVYVLEVRIKEDKMIVRDTGFGGDAEVTFSRDRTKSLLKVSEEQ